MTTHVFLMYGQGGQNVDAVLSADGLGRIESELRKIPGVVCYAPKSVVANPEFKGTFTWDAAHAIAVMARDVPKGDKLVIGGVSFGANETPFAASMLANLRDVDLIFGIQPSLYGRMNKVPPNVKRAVCIYNPIYLITGGLGAYAWERMSGNNRTEMIYVRSYWPHPGDNNASVRNRVLKEVQRLK